MLSKRERSSWRALLFAIAAALALILAGFQAAPTSTQSSSESYANANLAVNFSLESDAYVEK